MPPKLSSADSPLENGIHCMLIRGDEVTILFIQSSAEKNKGTAALYSNNRKELAITQVALVKEKIGIVPKPTGFSVIFDVSSLSGLWSIGKLVDQVYTKPELMKAIYFTGSDGTDHFCSYTIDDGFIVYFEPILSITQPTVYSIASTLTSDKSTGTLRIGPLSILNWHLCGQGVKLHFNAKALLLTSATFKNDEICEESPFVKYTAHQYDERLKLESISYVKPGETALSYKDYRLANGIPFYLAPYVTEGWCVVEYQRNKAGRIVDYLSINMLNDNGYTVRQYYGESNALEQSIVMEKGHPIYIALECFENGIEKKLYFAFNIKTKTYYFGHYTFNSEDYVFEPCSPSVFYLTLMRMVKAQFIEACWAQLNDNERSAIITGLQSVNEGNDAALPSLLPRHGAVQAMLAMSWFEQAPVVPRKHLSLLGLSFLFEQLHLQISDRKDYRYHVFFSDIRQGLFYVSKLLDEALTLKEYQAYLGQLLPLIDEPMKVMMPKIEKHMIQSRQDLFTLIVPCLFAYFQKRCQLEERCLTQEWFVADERIRLEEENERLFLTFLQLLLSEQSERFIQAGRQDHARLKILNLTESSRRDCIINEYTKETPYFLTWKDIIRKEYVSRLELQRQEAVDRKKTVGDFLIQGDRQYRKDLFSAFLAFKKQTLMQALIEKESIVRLNMIKQWEQQLSKQYLSAETLKEKQKRWWLRCEQEKTRACLLEMIAIEALVIVQAQAWAESVEDFKRGHDIPEHFILPWVSEPYLQEAFIHVRNGLIRRDLPLLLFGGAVRALYHRQEYQPLTDQVSDLDFVLFAPEGERVVKPEVYQVPYKALYLYQMMFGKVSFDLTVFYVRHFEKRRLVSLIVEHATGLDFTCNAVYCSETQVYHPFFSSESDIREQWISTIVPTTVSFEADPVRLLRFFALMAKGYQASDETYQRIYQLTIPEARLNPGNLLAVLRSYVRKFENMPHYRGRFFEYLEYYQIWEKLFPNLINRPHWNSHRSSTESLVNFIQTLSSPSSPSAGIRFFPPAPNTRRASPPQSVDCGL